MAGRTNNITVATLFAGIPTDLATDYDRKCGFDDSRQAMTARREEDTEALAALNAKPRHLDFFDRQYGIANDPAAMVNTVSELIKSIRPEFVLAPLGLLHPDHVTARDVTLNAASGPVILYEELPYRVTHPEVVEAAVSDVGGLSLEFIGDGPLQRKLTALWCYRSQMRLPEFDSVHNMLVCERFWRAAP
jgi:LmbE family N-acetylglucosaminyl deacetylase